MIDMFSSPEFWNGFAFVLVLIVFMPSFLEGLKRWTEKKVDLIHREQTAAQEVLKKAEEIKTKYEKAYINRFSEKRRLMQEADNEIVVLDEEQRLLTMDRINRKKQEIDLRLKMIAENGRQDIKRKILNQIIEDTRCRLKKKAFSENAEDVLQNALKALDKQGQNFFKM
jgi:F0F1-type ATP synthase membrane subunit b/b'